MSYVVSIWKQPADLPWPATLKEAVHQLDQLFKRPEPPHPDCQRLLQRLRARYPEHARSSEDDDDADSPWLEGLDDVLPDDQPVFNFGLMSGDLLDEAQACVVAEAVSLGLNVFDDQAGELHLGNGHSLGVDDRAACVRALDALNRREPSEAAQRLRELLPQGNRLARQQLGQQYLAGQGVRQDAALGAALQLSALNWEAGEGQRWRPADDAARQQVQQLRQQIGPELLKLATAWLPSLLPGRSSRMTPAEAIAQAEADHDRRMAELEQRIRSTPGLAPWDEMLALAQRGHPTAQYLASLMLTDGRGVAADPAQALVWLRRAARAGHAEGLYNLAWHHAQGEGVAQDLEAARRLYTLSARAGCQRALQALNNLGQRGQTAAPDLAALQRAAEAGDADSQFKLGECYTDGVPGLPANAEQGLHWFLQAARQGHAAAQYAMGCACLTGEGRPADPAGAVYWWEQAAAQGHASSLFNLGLAHLKGEGTPVNRSQARASFIRAAQGGSAAAFYNLGVIYQYGMGVPEQAVLAQALQRLARQHGHACDLTPLPVADQLLAQTWAADLRPGNSVGEWLARYAQASPEAPAARRPTQPTTLATNLPSAPPPARDGLGLLALLLGAVGMPVLLLWQPATPWFRAGMLLTTLAAAVGAWRVGASPRLPARLLRVLLAVFPVIGIYVCAVLAWRHAKPAATPDPDEPQD